MDLLIFYQTIISIPFLKVKIKFLSLFANIFSIVAKNKSSLNSVIHSSLSLILSINNLNFCIFKLRPNFKFCNFSTLDFSLTFAYILLFQLVHILIPSKTGFHKAIFIIIIIVMNMADLFQKNTMQNLKILLELKILKK